MKQPLIVSIICLVLVMLYSCSYATNEQPEKSIKSQTDIPELSEINYTNMSDDTPRVTGIGGVFFQSEDPKASREWYGKHLGLAITDWGSPFEFRNANRPEEINYLSWSPFAAGGEFMDPTDKVFMINYRVQHIEKLVENLRADGVTILDEIVSYDYGKFVHILDHEGNKIELWEPVDHIFTEMGGETTK